MIYLIIKFFCDEGRECLSVLRFTYTCQLDACHVVGRNLLSLDWIEIESLIL